MRIVGGEFRGRRLRAPSGRATRPTTERTREALFNILEHGGGEPAPAQNAMVLDLFAGSGALGFEALSRGARQVTFIENNRRAAELILTNARTLGAEDKITVLRRDAGTLGRPTARFALVLMDAPYGSGLSETALAALAARRWLTPDARLVIELAADEAFRAPPGYTEQHRRHYGAAQLVFLRAEASET